MSADRGQNRSEAYLDIVWRQFKKNSPAYWSLWLLIPWALTAIFAPLLASNVPLVYDDGRETLYPWFRALFHPAEPVDFFFNMALLGFAPWLLLAVATNFWLKRRKTPGRRRLGIVALEYVAVLAVLCFLFSFDALRPNNRYRGRDFVREDFRNPNATAVYPLIPFGPIEPDLDAIFKPPSLLPKPASLRSKANDSFPHLLGTDDAGRDVLVRMIHGTRIAMTVGFVAVGLYITIGVLVGAVAGYFGGATDFLISRIIEIVLVFPAFFLIITLVGLIGPSIYIIMFVIGVTGWPTVARLTRGEVLKQRGVDYVAAARALGASNGRVIFRHVLPNSLSPALVAAPFGVARAIIIEAGLSLLGFGVRPPAPSWGSLLQLASRNYSYWWLIVFPSIAIFATVTIFNLVGNGLRDAMDPKLRM